MATRKKSTSKEPFLPLFFGDFLGATAEWDGEERALYLLLLGYQWTLGSLPADTRKLRKLADYQEETFNRWWPTVSTKFDAKGDRLVNPRLEQHRAKTVELSGKNAESGKKGAAARWRKDGERHANGMANATDSNSERHQSANGVQMADAINKSGDRHENANGERYGAPDGNPSHPIPSHPIPEDLYLASPPNSDVRRTLPHAERAKSGKAEKQNGAGNGHDAAFEEIRTAYPKRSGGQRWQDAMHAYNARRREGHAHEAILAGVQRYAAHIRAKGDEGTSFVQQAATFLGTNRGFLEPWTAAPTKADQRLNANIDAAAEAKRQLLEESR